MRLISIKHNAIAASRALLACLGLTLALFGGRLIEPQAHEGQMSSLLAKVNQKPISAFNADNTSQRLWGRPFAQLNNQQQQTLVQVLIDEELLLQRAESLDIASTDPGLRKTVVAAAVDQIVAEFLNRPVTEAELQQFYQDQSSVFETPTKVAVDGLLIKKPAQIQQAKSMLALGHSLAYIADLLQLDYLLPRALLPIHSLHRQLGGSMANTALMLEQGEISAAIQRPEGQYFLQVTQVQQPKLLPYKTIRNTVLLEYQRRGREKALESKLGQLWEHAHIQIAGAQ
ncbi:MAG: peptidylprolyl isomerase [Porticoccaceae bacterium]|nr:peptidylprolyl isomerase [Porticoccaceae bacterium]MDG1311612.1 peptidylprolyl isomerase [Porticoccaceae bacterium]